MANQAKLQCSVSVIPQEILEALDTSDTNSRIHSKIDKALGSSILKTLSSVSAMVYESSQTINSTSYTVFDGNPCTYEGFTWAVADVNGGVKNIDFFFCRIIEPVTAGQTPDIYITLDNGTTNLIRLTGTGDFCIIPLNNYTIDDGLGTTYLKVKAVSTSTYANIEWLVAKI